MPARQQWRMTVPGGLRGHQQGHMGGGLWSFLNVSFLPSTQEIREPAGGEVVPCGRPARRRSRLGHSQKAQSLNGHTEKVLTGKTFSISSLTRLSQPAPCPCPWSSSQTRPTVAQEIKSKRLRYRRQVALSQAERLWENYHLWSKDRVPQIGIPGECSVQTMVA